MLAAKFFYLIATAIDYQIGAFQPAYFLRHLQIALESLHPPVQSTSEKGVVAFRDTHFVVFDKLVGYIEVGVNFNATLLQIATKPSLFIDKAYAVCDRRLVVAATIRLNHGLATCLLYTSDAADEY